MTMLHFGLRFEVRWVEPHSAKSTRQTTCLRKLWRLIHTPYNMLGFSWVWRMPCASPSLFWIPLLQFLELSMGTIVPCDP